MAEFRDSIEIEAPPQAVFEYLTTNEGMTAWMGQYADLDPVPGGRFAVDIAGVSRAGASTLWSSRSSAWWSRGGSPAVMSCLPVRPGSSSS